MPRKNNSTTFSDIRSLQSLPKNLSGKRVLVRADLNVPFSGNRVYDDTRVKALVPTLTLLRRRKAKVVVVSHLGDGTKSLRPVARVLSKYIPVRFSDVSFNNAAGVVASLDNGEIVVLENLRRDRGEKKNTAAFAKTLAALGDYYVNDAFSASHRAHASIVSVPKYLPAYAGALFHQELKGLSQVFKPRRPFLFILGGAKATTKMPFLKKYLAQADKVFIGGALANDFFVAAGYSVGKSRTSDVRISRTLLNNKKILLPIDVVVKKGGHRRTCAPSEVKAGEYICDSGPATNAFIRELIEQSRFIVMNGPLGDYEHGCARGTNAMLRDLANTSGTTILGGGDTTGLVSKLQLDDKYTFVSKSGGAMLEFLARGILPGITALQRSGKTTRA